MLITAEALLDIHGDKGGEQLTDGLLVTVYQQGGSCEGQRGVVYRAGFMCQEHPIDDAFLTNDDLAQRQGSEPWYD